MRWLLALALVVAAPAASADPISAFVALQPLLGSTLAAFVVSNAAAIALVGAGLYSSASARRKARRAAAEQRAAYNASLTDRTATVLQADPPHRIVFGRAIVGGNVVAMFTSDKTGYRENGFPYTKPDGLRHLVIEIAHQQCAAINEVYIDGIPVGALDINGWATGGEFAAPRGDSRGVTVPASGFLDVPDAVVSILQAFYYDATSSSANVDVTPTLSLGNTRITNPVAHDITVNYTTTLTVSRVRVSKHLGTDTQAVDAYLNSVAPAEWDASHRGLGVTYVVLTEDLEETRFQAGPSNYTFDVSGGLFEDPRTGLVAWTDNPAIIIRGWLRAEYGYGCAASDVDDTYAIAAANACDELIALTVDGVTTMGKRYTCNGSFTTDQSKEAVLEDLVECMTGKAVYGAAWMIMAGVWTPPVTLPNGASVLTDDDLDGQIELLQAGSGMDDIFNGLRGQYIPAGKAVSADIKPPYQNATFVAADGEELWSDISLPFTDNPARARNIARIKTEQARSGMVIRYPAKLMAWPLRVGDRIGVNSAEYAFDGKLFRVTDWQFGITAPVLLTLQEDAAEIWDEADAAVSDPTPNSGLQNPWTVEPIAGVTAVSSSEWILGSDGTVVPRVTVSWTALTDPYVLNGSGRIELLWRRNADMTWHQINLPGDSTTATFDGVRNDDRIVVELRSVNGFGKPGASSFVAHTVSSSTPVPSNVSGLSAAVALGAVKVTWNASADPAYAYTELRHGAVSWGTATSLFKGKAGSFTWPSPSPGTYTIRAKHFNNSGQESAADTTYAITFTAADIAASTAQIQPNGATTIVSDASPSGTLTATTAVEVATTVKSVTYTNSSSENVEIEATAMVLGLLSGGTGTCYYSLTCASSGGAGGIYIMGSLTTAEQPYINLQHFILAPGETATAEIEAKANCTSGASTSNNWRNATVRLTIIKR